MKAIFVYAIMYLGVLVVSTGSLFSTILLASNTVAYNNQYSNPTTPLTAVHPTDIVQPIKSTTLPYRLSAFGDSSLSVRLLKEYTVYHPGENPGVVIGNAWNTAHGLYLSTARGNITSFLRFDAELTSYTRIIADPRQYAVDGTHILYMEPQPNNEMFAVGWQGLSSYGNPYYRARLTSDNKIYDIRTGNDTRATTGEADPTGPGRLEINTRISKWNDAFYFATYNSGVRVYKTDMNCKTIWDKRYTLDSTWINNEYDIINTVNGAVVDNDGLILVGQRIDSNIDPLRRTPSYNTLRKIDENGAVLWERNYLFPDSLTQRSYLDITKTASNDMIILGLLTRRDKKITERYIELIQIDHDGQIVEVDTLPNISNSMPFSLRTHGNNIYITCRKVGFADTTTVLKFDREKKRISWSKTYTGWTMLYGNLPMDDSTTLVYGMVSHDEGASYGSYIALLRETTDVATSVSDNTPAMHESTLVLSPSPAESYVDIRTSMSNNGNLLLRLFTMTGQEVFSEKMNSAEYRLSLEKLPAQCYTLVVTNGNVSSARILPIIR